MESEIEFTNYQINRAQVLKRVAENYEVTKSLLELTGGKPEVFASSVDSGNGDVPVKIRIELVINNQFNFGQFLARKSLMYDLIYVPLLDVEGKEVIDLETNEVVLIVDEVGKETAEDIVEFARQKYIIHHGEDTRGMA